MSALNPKKTRVICLDEVESTQETAREWLLMGKIKEETIITARFQRIGKGRGINRWDSKKGENLLLTWVLFPDFLNPERQFFLSMVTALSLIDLVSSYLPGCLIKWPNDIYVEEKKIAGILIENDIQDNHIVSSLIGIGLNVNQTKFPSSLPNPVSLKTISSKDWDTDWLLEQLIRFFKKRYENLRTGDINELPEEYITRLYLYNKEALYKTQEGEIRARITGVDRYGRLLLTNEEGRTRAYGMEAIRQK